MILMDTGNMKMTLSGVPEPIAGVDSDGVSVYRQIADDSGFVETNLTIRGEGNITWPNREGEIFSLSEAHERLLKIGRADSGISLCWPATASVQAVGMIDDESIHTFLANPEPRGKVRFLELASDKPGLVRFKFRGASVTWRMLSIPLSDSDQNRDCFVPELSLYQIGLIGPDGECEVPIDRGFRILDDAARALIVANGVPVPGDVIHIFGYAEGHDRGYPDYTPSEKLGGAAALKSAIGELGELGFETSLYLNARLAELTRLTDYPGLKDAVLTDTGGRPLFEVYRGRDFAVMNPSSPQWISHLLNEARRLKELGAAWVQLDQIAGRAAPVNPGVSWGMGYKRLIEGIHRMGMKVWIQGVSNYYPVDAFEATWRPVTVLDDGTLRGGWPMGSPDTTLIESTGFSGRLIVPEIKREALERSGLTRIYDRCAEDDGLPLWGASWLNNLDKMQLPRCGVHKNL